MNALETVLKDYGFTEDLDPLSTIVVGGPVLATRKSVVAAYVEAEHPRDERGRWAKKAGSDARDQPEIGAPQFQTREEAEEWFRGFGVEDVNLAGIEELPHGLDIARAAAAALVRESQMFPGIMGENGLKALLMSSDPRVMAAGLTHNFSFEEGSWAVTLPYADILDPYNPLPNGVTQYPSAVVFSGPGIADPHAIAMMALNGMAPGDYEQAFAHELGHVHENSLGWKRSMDAYFEAAANVEEEMAFAAGVRDFRSQLHEDGDGQISDPLFLILTHGVSPYTMSSPREAFAEHFVRRTYPESYGRVPTDPPELRFYADRIADEYNRLMGERHL